MNNGTISGVILTVVILLTFALAFLLTYYFFYSEKKKVIRKGLDDDEIREDIQKKKCKWMKKDKNKHLSFEQEYFNSRSSKKTVGRVISGILFTILLAFTIFVSVEYVQVKNDNFLYINNKTVLVIKTSSMETTNDSNSYLKNNSDTEYQYINTRLERYSLVSIDKYYQGDELKLYDIVAFKMDDTVIVHRLIQIGVDKETGQKVYTFRGDANNASFVHETNVTEDKIIGKFNGYYNVGMGYVVSFLQSEIGLISLIILCLSIVAYTMFNDGIDSAYEKRMEELLKNHHRFKKKAEVSEACVDELSPIAVEKENVEE